MRLALVLPRYARFGAHSGTSIDLCVRDFVWHSRFQADTGVIAPPVAEPPQDLSCLPVGRPNERHRPRIRAIIDCLREQDPELVVVHQHLRTAAAVAAALPATPVLLHTHNFERPPRGRVDRLLRARRYRSLAGLIFVSHACRVAFRRHWPEVRVPAFVAYNGLRFDAWRPQAERERQILYVGRLAREKGVAELVEALPQVLRDDWQATLIVSEAGHEPEFAASTERSVAALDGRAEMLHDLPHEQVQRHFESSAIAVVPSRYDEPFGRTALEAFAGGAALVTSGSGGLPEVVGDSAVTAECHPTALAEALEGLIDDPARRQSFAQKGRERGRRLFAIERCASVLDDVYARWLEPASIASRPVPANVPTAGVVVP